MNAQDADLTPREGAPWRPKAVLLDFYGTVVAEDDRVLRQICERIASLSGVPRPKIGALWSCRFRQLCAASHGAAFLTQRQIEQQSLQEVLHHVHADLNPLSLSSELFDYWTRPPILPESRTALSRCSLPICLVSNIDNAPLNSALASLGLRFDHVVTSEGCRAYKPRPEMFLCALDRLGLRAGDVLHVGDSLGSDVGGASSLGIRTLWINRLGRTLPPGGPSPTWTASSLQALVDLL